MTRRALIHSASCVVTCLLALCFATTPQLWAQHGSEGTVAVTVLDTSGSVVPGAQLQLQDLATNNVRTAQTQDNGTYTFVNLSLGKYKLSISKTGFKSQVFNDVVVQAAQTTDIKSALPVGTVNETIEVNGGAAPLVETTTNAIGTTVDLKQIEDLPIQGRDLTQLTQLVPGYTGTLADGGGTWNGLPSIAQGSNIDGVVGSASRMKFSGAAEPAVEPRVENIEEMTVQTDQLDLNQGFGNSTMQINFVTRRGTNAFHGRVYEDHRDDFLNANSWFNDAATYLDPSNPLKKNHFILNEFGGSLGGPIIKDKLFFFGTFAMSKQPGSINTSEWVLTPSAIAGNFNYTDSNGNPQSINVLNIAGGKGFPTSNDATTAILGKISSAANASTVIPVSDPTFEQLNWLWPNPTTTYYPTVRVDFIPNSAMRFNVAWNMTKTTQPGANPPNLPGPDFANTAAGNRFKSYTAALGFDWTLSPTVVNDLRGGFLYNGNFFAYNGQQPTPGQQQIGWNFGNLPFYYSNTAMNGTDYQVPTGSYYPVFNASDTLTWVHKAHTINFGFSWWREQNHYYNGVLGYPFLSMGLANGDPALNAFTSGASGSVPNSSGSQLSEAEELYAVLVGRVSGISGSYAYEQSSDSYLPGIGTYNLDELQKAFGFFVQDSYRFKPTLTLNYGLRWDLTWPDYDLTNAYHSAAPDAIWGPSGINNLFNPGVLNGTSDPQLTQNSAPAKPWYVAPQPAVGIAWNPKFENGLLNKLTGLDKTVIRAGFSLRRFTEPQQYFWNQASDYAAVYFQSFYANANNSGTAGTFAPGSLSWLGQDAGTVTSPQAGGQGVDLPNGYGMAPTQFLKSYSFSQWTFQGGPGINGVESNIRQPYTESWNLGIQRQLSESRAIEIRYVGNRSLRQWIVLNPNEVNIFENGFLTQFKAAQANLAANNASGNASYVGSFANHGLTGQQALPFFDAAFAGEGLGADGSLADYTNSGFENDVATGSAGALASQFNSIFGNADYFCNLVPAGSFAPCANVGYTGSGGPYPINVLQVNPFAANLGSSELVSKGYSNYNSLQLDFRQRNWHGLQFDANYTWSHTLGISTQNNWQGLVTAFTLRDMRLSYGPTLFDIRNAIHINGTYDLPFGRGKQFANRGGIVDRVVGGWTIGSIFTFQTGNPFLLQGGYNTFNDYADGGVVLNGVTASQLQKSIGVYRIPGQAAVDFINPKYLASNGTGGGANSSFITPNTTPGTFGQLVWLHGPHWINDDLSISKHVPITERVRFSLQVEMLNAFNHPTFQPGSGAGCSYYCYAAGGGFPNVQAFGFGIGGSSPSYQPRNIELRGNIEF
ncbi:MAG TPA: TonB-dependent receptor [Verrucomicrobiae bacterium]|nr:TonB-dependent receptor [Verrucomicrobiae bacterium]